MCPSLWQEFWDKKTSREPLLQKQKHIFQIVLSFCHLLSPFPMDLSPDSVLGCHQAGP